MSQIGELLQRHILGRVNVAADHLRSVNCLMAAAANFAENVPANDRQHFANDLREIVTAHVSDQTTIFMNPLTWEDIQSAMKERGWEL